eukprot:657658-Prorocentrum_minimum.AAC.1
MKPVVEDKIPEHELEYLIEGYTEDETMGQPPDPLALEPLSTMQTCALLSSSERRTSPISIAEFDSEASFEPLCPGLGFIHTMAQGVKS